MGAVISRETISFRAHRLGRELARLRDEANKEPADVQALLKCSQSKVSLFESGRRGIRELDLDLLLDLYEVEDEETRRSIHKLAKERNKKNWWSQDGPLLDSALTDFMQIEEDSSLICTYQPTLVPGLLQTESYSQVMFDQWHAGEDQETLLRIRARRKEALKKRTDLQLRVVLDATALSRIPSELRKEQLEHLLSEARLPAVTLQILALESSLPLNQYPPYTLCTLLGSPPSMQIVWLEHLTGGTMLEGEDDVAGYNRAWAEMTSAALPPADSLAYIRNMIKETEKQ